MAEISKETWNKLQKEQGLSTLEAPDILQKDNKKLFIGIPKETAYQEKRISLTPSSVNNLTNKGHRVVIESGAGEASSFPNNEYINAGAEIAYEREKVFEADILLKSAPITTKECSLFQKNQIIFSPLLASQIEKEYLQDLMNKKITAFAYEYIKDEYGSFPFLQSMSEIAGSYAILTAAKYLSNEYGRGILLGSIAGHPPAKVVIIGAGSVGLAAARAAIGMGATVQVFDDNHYRLRRLQNILNQRVYTSVIDPYALLQKLKSAHVVIGALAPVDGKTPIVVSEEMVAAMKENSVIVDVSIDHGGCFETSRVTDFNNPFYRKHGVIHYCVPNIASNVSRSASYALSNIISPMLHNVSKIGGFDKYIRYFEGLRHGVYVYKGAVTNEHIAKRFYLKYTDLELLLTAEF